MRRTLQTQSGLAIVTDETPKFRCRVCGALFMEQESLKYQRHVINCFDKNEAEVMSKSLEVRFPDLYGPESGDHERRKWVRRNRKGILDGKIKM